MRSIQETEMIALVKEWVSNHARIPDQDTFELRAETDLLTTGILDSVGFVELLAEMEAMIGWEIDLTDADPSEFVTIAGFCRIALRCEAGSGADGTS